MEQLIAKLHNEESQVSLLTETLKDREGKLAALELALQNARRTAEGFRKGTESAKELRAIHRTEKERREALEKRLVQLELSRGEEQRRRRAVKERLLFCAGCALALIGIGASAVLLFRLLHDWRLTTAIALLFAGCVVAILEWTGKRLELVAEWSTFTLFQRFRRTLLALFGTVLLGIVANLLYDFGRR
jgi:hypothetical protein